MNPIPVNTPLLGVLEKEYLCECIETGWISSEGPFVKSFESEFAAWVGRDAGIAVANGTAALDIAVRALGVSDGDEVICPSFTIISCAQAILNSGGLPVLVDACPLTWNMKPEDIRAKITDKTRAIMLVHIYGLPVDLDPILELAEEFNLKIIEDAAEVHGQTYKGKPCGSFGDISTFSFYPNKHITTGEGGMLVANDPELIDRCRSLRNLCFQPEQRFVHEELGWNYRMTNLQAALGLAQLKRADEIVAAKRELGSRYEEAFKELPFFERAPTRVDFAENIYWVFGLVVADDAPFTRDEITSYLASQKIGTRPFFWGMHEQPVFRKQGLFLGSSYPVTERLGRRGFYLPSGLGLSDDDQRRVIDAVWSFCNGAAKRDEGL